MTSRIPHPLPGESIVGNGIIKVRGIDIQQLLLHPFDYIDLLFLELRGDGPTDLEKLLLTKALIADCEHGYTSPSTHPARVVSNVGGSFEMSAIAFIAAASGKYHFGALGLAMTEIKQVTDLGQDPHAYTLEKLAAGERIWGFGHRFHTSRQHPDLPEETVLGRAERIDPRVDALITLADREKWDNPYLATVRGIGRTLYEKKQLPINVDGAVAGYLLGLGFAPEVAPLFVFLGRLPFIARMHKEEQGDHNRFVGLVDRNDPSYRDRTVDHDSLIRMPEPSIPLESWQEKRREQARLEDVPACFPQRTSNHFDEEMEECP